MQTGTQRTNRLHTSYCGRNLLQWLCRQCPHDAARSERMQRRGSGAGNSTVPRPPFTRCSSTVPVLCTLCCTVACDDGRLSANGNDCVCHLACSGDRRRISVNSARSCGPALRTHCRLHTQLRAVLTVSVSQHHWCTAVRKQRTWYRRRRLREREQPQLHLLPPASAAA